jgi:hypothetical protein
MDAFVVVMMKAISFQQTWPQTQRAAYVGWTGLEL